MTNDELSKPFARFAIHTSADGAKDAEIARLRQALEPFAKYGKMLADNNIPPECRVRASFEDFSGGVTVGDLRRAKEALDA